ncbi:MAG: UDP-3-O-[3-hydroxymyristoyl] N-acetylglucosamine deacetylase [Elusimicrobia bacterium]|nr:UDP-3-O-[3-hydroxymyristoyl] N-acetylglucosamine deacetylase [Elusimicrobiota bacterium]
MRLQTTLKETIEISGTGIHTGFKSSLKLIPAPPASGIVFRSAGVDIPASLDNIIETQRSTTLGKNGTKIRTVEHLLSALRGLGVDNVLIEIDNDETPVMDGSAWPFVQAIEKAGIVKQEKNFRTIWEYAKAEPFVFQTGLSSYKVLPKKGFSVSVSISFPDTVIGTQELEFNFNGSYAADISRARTFCLESDVERLRKAGLAKGGSLDNAIVVGKQKVYCHEPLRYKDEFVRHKILDFLGDLSLIACGDYHFHCAVFAPNHTANLLLAKELKKYLTIKR